MPIKIKEFFNTDTVLELVEKMNFNFDQIVLNGGGLRGFKGAQGESGQTGNTGRSGAQIQTGSFAPKNDAASLQVISENILNLQIGDYYLYSGEDSVLDGYFLGDLFQIIENSGTTPGFTLFELQYKMNLRGPAGEVGDIGNQLPSYITSDVERFIKRNEDITTFSIPLRPIDKIKPFMPIDVRLNLQNRNLIDFSAETYLNENASNIILLESFKTVDIGGQPFGTEGIAVNLVVEDPEFEELNLSSSDILSTRSGELTYSFNQSDSAYTLSLKNKYESPGKPGDSSFPPISGFLNLESSRSGDINLNYGNNLTIDIQDDAFGDENSYSGGILMRSKRSSTILNEVSDSTTNLNYIDISQINTSLNSLRPSSQIRLTDRNIKFETLASASPSQNINTIPGGIANNVDYISHNSPVGSSYQFLVNTMIKSNSKFFTYLDQSSGGNYIHLKSSYNRGNGSLNDALNSSVNKISPYFLSHDISTGITSINGNIASLNGEERSVRSFFNADGISLQRISTTPGGINSNNSRQLPYLDLKTDLDARGFLIGAGSSNTTSDNYVEFRPGAGYHIYYNQAENSNFKVGFGSNPLNQLERYAFSDGSISISNTQNNGPNRSLNFYESNFNAQGFRFVYKSSTDNALAIENADVAGVWNPALLVNRSNGSVGFKIENSSDLSHDLTIGSVNVGITWDESASDLLIQQGNSSNGALVLSSIGDVIISADSNANDPAGAKKRIVFSTNTDVDSSLLTGKEVKAWIPDEPSGSIIGRSEGNIHINGSLTDSNYIAGLSFGHGNSADSSSTGAHAGIFASSGGSFGTRLYMMTTDSYVNGRRNGIVIDKSGNLWVGSDPGGTISMAGGNTINIAKQQNDSFIRFAAQPGSSGNDPGFIQHREVNNFASMIFQVSDDFSSNDNYIWRGGSNNDVMSLTATGNLNINGSYSMDGSTVIRSDRHFVGAGVSTAGAINTNNDYRMDGVTVINSNKEFVGTNIDINGDIDCDDITCDTASVDTLQIERSLSSVRLTALRGGTLSGGGFDGSEAVLFIGSGFEALWNDANNNVIGSDVRIKSSIEPISNSISIINKLKPTKYNVDDSTHFGFIAQDVEKVENINWAVLETTERVSKTGKVIKNFKGIEYNNFHALSIAGIQDLHKENVKLKEELKDIKEQLEELKLLIKGK